MQQTQIGAVTAQNSAICSTKTGYVFRKRILEDLTNSNGEHQSTSKPYICSRSFGMYMISSSWTFKHFFFFKDILRNKMYQTSLPCATVTQSVCTQMLSRLTFFYFLPRLRRVTRFRQDGRGRISHRKTALSGRASAQQTVGQQD